MTDKIEIEIPFNGFYGTLHEMHMDDEIDMTLEDDENPDIEYDDLIIDMKGYMKSYAKHYVSIYNDKIKEETDIDLQLEFAEIISPREYNFSNDRIFAKAELSTMVELLTNVANRSDALQEFKDTIEERFTSRSGFISFYPNALTEWGSAMEWDCNQWGTLLESIVGDLGEDCLDDSTFRELPNEFIKIEEKV